MSRAAALPHGLSPSPQPTHSYPGPMGASRPGDQASFTFAPENPTIVDIRKHSINTF